MYFQKEPKEFKTAEDINEFIAVENPYEGITEKEKIIINRIGTSLNNVIRQRSNLGGDILFQKELLQRLIKSHSLKEDIIVHRGVESIHYETQLAKGKGYPEGYLYHNGFVYTTLLFDYTYYRNVYMNILIPKGTNYLFTGYFSNIAGNDLQDSNSKHNAGDGELILDIGTVFKIDRKQMTIDKYGKERTIYDVHVVSVSDWANE